MHLLGRWLGFQYTSKKQHIQDTISNAHGLDAPSEDQEAHCNLGGTQSICSIEHQLSSDSGLS